MSSFPDKNFLSTKEASRIFGYTPDYLARLAREKKIGRVRVGKSWLIKRDSLERFVALQGEHKKELARAAAHAREVEYKQANSVPVRLTRIAQKVAPVALQSPGSVAFVVRQIAAAAFSVLVVAGAAYASSGNHLNQVFAKAQETIDLAAEGFAYLVGDITSGTRARISNARAYRLSYEPKTLAQINTIVDSKSTSRFTALPQAFAFFATYESGMDTFVRDDISPTINPDVEEMFAAVAHAVAHPRTIPAALYGAYVRMGETLYGAAERTIALYGEVIDGAGDALLAAALTTRDRGVEVPLALGGAVASSLDRVAEVANSVLDTYTNAMYAYAAYAPELPARVVVAVLDIGGTTASFVQAIPGVLVASSDAFATAWVEETQALMGEVLVAHERFAFGAAAAAVDAYAGAGVGARQVAGAATLALDVVSNSLRNSAITLSAAMEKATDGAKSAASGLAFAVAGIRGDSIENALLGFLGKSAATLEESIATANNLVAGTYTSVMSSAANIVPAVPALPQFSVGERAALFTYKTINGFFNRVGDAVAFLFESKPQVVVVDPVTPEPKPGVVLEPEMPSTPEVVATAASTTIIERVRETVAPQTTVYGLLRADVEQMFVSFRHNLFADILDTIYPLDYDRIAITRSTFSRGTVTDSHLIDSTILDSTFQGPSVTTDLLTVQGNASVSGNLTVDGVLNISSIVSSGAVSAPYFTATSTTASIFPFASTTMLTASLASTTDLIVSSLTQGLVPFATTSGQFVDSPDFAFDSALARLSVPYASTTMLTSNIASTTDIIVSSLTEGRVPLVGVGGAIIDTASFTFDTTTGTLAAPYASSTAGSLLDVLFVGRTATTTIRGDGFASILPYASSTALTVSGTGYFGTASTTNLTVSSLTSGRVPFATADGVVVDSANLAFDATLNRLSVPYASTTMLTANVASTTDLVVSSLTNGRIPFITVAGQFVDSATLAFDTILNRLSVPFASTTMITSNTASTTNLNVSGATRFESLTPSRLLSLDGSGVVSSVAALTNWIAGTANQITVTDDLDGTVTLSLPSTLVFTNATSSNLFASRLTANTFAAGQTGSTTISSTGALVTPSLTATNLTATRIPFITAGGLFTDSLDLAFDVLTSRLSVPFASTTMITSSVVDTADAYISSLTSGRIPFASTAGKLVDSASFVFDIDSNRLTVPNASTTELSVAQNATVGGTLGVTGLSTFGNGFIANASSTVAGDLTTTGDVVVGGAITINGSLTSSVTSGQIQFLAAPQGTSVDQGSVYINPASAGTNNVLLGVSVNGSERMRIDAEGDVQIVGLFNSTNTVGTNQLSGNLSVLGNTILGNASSDTVTVNAGVASDLIPDADITRDLGSALLRWANIHTANLVVDNLVAGGTASTTFIINEGNVSADAEDSSLQFSRGLNAPNAILKWDSVAKRFDFNDFPVRFQNSIIATGSASSTFAGPVWMTGTPLGAALADAALFVNPSAASTNHSLFSVGVAGVERFRVDAEGDTTVQGSLGVENALFDISADTLTVDDKLRITGNEIVDSGNTTRITLGATNTVTGNLSVTGDITGATVAVSNLTSGRVPFVTTNGQLTDVSNFTFSSGVLRTYAFAVNGNYASTASVPGTAISAANASHPDGFGALIVSSRNDATRPIIFATYNGTAFDERGRITAGGRLGLGTTTPAAMLGVAGSGYFAGNVTAQNLIATSSISAPYISTTNASSTLLSVASGLYNSYLTSGRVPFTTTNGLLTDNAGFTFDGSTLTAPVLSASNASATTTLAGGLTVGGNTLVVDRANSRVYIGAATALDAFGGSRKLEVNGDLLTNGSVRARGAAGGTRSINLSVSSATGILDVTGGSVGGTEVLSLRPFASAGNGYITFYNANTGPGSREVMRLTNGTLGIGTTTPAATLGVAGSGYFSANVTAQSFIATSSISTPSLTVTGLTASRLVATDGSSNLTSSITAANLASSVTGTTGTAGNLVFSVSPTFTGTPVLPSAYTIGANSFTRSGANDLTITTTGTTNVTLPTSGTLYGTAANSITSANLISSVTDETGTGALVFGTAPTIASPSITGNTTLANASSTNLFASALTANTFAAGQTGSTTISSTGALVTPSLTATSLTATRIPFITTGGLFTDSSALTFNSTSGILATTYASTTALSSTGSAFFATSGGGVGVGTTTPAAMLGVAGSGYFAGDVTAQNLIATSSISAPTIAITGLTPGRVPFVSTGGQLADSSDLAWDSGTNRLTARAITINGGGLSVTGSGNVSINANISSVSNITMTGVLTSSNASAGAITLSGANAGINFTSGSGTKTIATGGSSNLNLAAGGSVGIGTANPITALDVNGSLAYTGTQVARFVNATNLRTYKTTALYGSSGQSQPQWVRVGYFAPGSSWAEGSAPTITVTKNYYDSASASTEYVLYRTGVLGIVRNTGVLHDVLRVAGPVSYGGRANVYELWVEIPAYNTVIVESSHMGRANVISNLNPEASIYEPVETNTIVNTNPGGLARASVTGIVTTTGGNVGLGTLSPAYRLTVEGTSSLGNQAIAGYFTATSTTATSTFAGSVGIGTATARRALDIRTTGNAISSTNVDVSELALSLTNTGGTNQHATGLGFSVASDSTNIGAAIIHQRLGSQSYGGLHFATKPSGAAADADIPIRLSIDSTGFVGVGTTSPLAKLTISETSGSNDASLAIYDTTNNNYLSLAQGNTVSNIKAVGSDALRFSVGATTDMVSFMSDGKVGIGTTSPSQRLDINAAFTSWGGWVLGGNPGGPVGLGAGNSAATRYISAGGTSNSFFHNVPSGGGYTFAEGETTRVRIQTGGNVGIGTTAPGDKLSVIGAIKSQRLSVGDSTGIRLGSDDTHQPTIQFNASDDSVRAKIAVGDVNAGGGDRLGFSVYPSIGTDALSIRGSGNVGIGITSPTAKLHVVGSPRFVPSSTSSGTSNAVWIDTPKNIVSLFLGDHNSVVGYGADEYSGDIRFNGSDVAWGDFAYYPNGGDAGENGHFRFTTNSSTVGSNPNAKVGVGSLYAVSGIGVGTASPSGLLDVAGSFYTSNGRINIRPQDGVNEGGEITLMGAASYDAATIDNRSGDVRIFWGGTSDHQVSIFNSVSGSAHLSVQGNIFSGGSLASSRVLLDSTTFNPMGYATTDGNDAVVAAVSGNTAGGTVSQSGSSLVLQAGIGTGSGANGDIIFRLANNNVNQGANTRHSAPTEYMRIKAESGAVGIGTSNPQNLLQIGSNPAGHGGNDFTVSNANGSVSIHNLGGSSYVYSSQRLDLLAQGAGISVLTSGNVGIGETSPTSKLFVKGNATIENGITGTPDWGNNTLELRALSGTTASLDFHRVGQSSAQIYSDDGSLAFGTDSGIERMRIQTITGNVGIGTATPTTKLQVYGGSASVINTSGVAELYVGESSTNYIALNYDTTNNYGYIGSFAGAATKLVLNPTGGNVGIGTTNPAARLQVSGLVGDGVSNAAAVLINATLQTGGVNGLNQTGLSVAPTFDTWNSNVANAYGLRVSPVHAGMYVTTNAYGLYVDATSVSSGTVTNNYAAAFMGGNVGIGIASPTVPLDVAGTVRTNNTFVIAQSGTHASPTSDGLNIGANGASSGNYSPTIRFDVGGGGGGAKLFTSRLGGAGGRFYINTDNTSGTSLTRLFINENGDIGMGTITPKSDLQVSGSHGAITISGTPGEGDFSLIQSDNHGNMVMGNNLRLTSDSANLQRGASHASIAGGAVVIGGNSATGDLIAPNAVAIYSFAPGAVTAGDSVPTTPTAVFRAGNVGIGTTAPGERLEVMGNIKINGSTNQYVGVVPNTAINLMLGTGSGSEPRIYLHGTGNGQSNAGDIYLSAGGASNQLYLDNTGNVGIGTTTPYAKLSVAGQIVGEQLTITNTAVTSSIAGSLSVGNGAINYNNSTGVTSIQNLAFGALSFDTNAGVLSWIDMPVTAAAAAGTAMSYSAQLDGNPLLTVYGQSNGSGGIQNTGIGIGTTAPAAPLHIYDASLSALRIDNGNNALSAGASQLQFFAGASQAAANAKNFSINNLNASSAGGSNSLSFQSRNDDGTFKADLLTIMNSGNVGVGTANPATRLTVDSNSNSSSIRILGAAEASEIADMYVGSSGEFILSTTAGTGSGAYIDLRSEDNEYGLVLRESDGTGTLPYANFYVTDATDDRLSIGVNGSASVLPFHITAAGLVGVGISTPQAKLDVSTAITSHTVPAVRFTNTSGTGQLPLEFYINGTVRGKVRADYVGNMNYVSNGGNHVFFTGGDSGSGTERLRIDTSGNVGVGVTSSGSKLDVTGSASSGNSLMLRSGDTSGGTDSTQIRFGFNGTADYQHSIRTRHNAGAQAGNAIDFWVWDYGTDAAGTLGSKQVMTLDGNGNVGIGVAAPSAALHVKYDVSQEGFVEGGYTQAGLVIQNGDNGNGSAHKSVGIDLLPAHAFSGQPKISLIGDQVGSFGVSVGAIGSQNTALTVNDGGLVTVGFYAAASGNMLEVRDSTGTCTINPGAGASWSCSSDERLKHDIFNTAVNGLAYINDFRVRDYILNVDGSFHTGVIAQEVLAVHPELVTTTKDGLYAVSQPNSWLLVKALQELDARTSWMVATGTATTTATKMTLNRDTGYVGVGVASPLYAFHVAGEVAAEGFVNTSTRTAKKNIAYLSEDDAEDVLEKLLGVQTATYRYNTDSAGQPLRFGLIAEDLALVAPEVLAAGGKGVDLYKLATFTLTGVQALASKFDAITLRVNSLEERIAALEAGVVSVATGTDMFSTTTLKNALAEFGIMIENGIARFQTLVFRELVASKDEDGTSSAGSVTILAGNTVAQVENALVRPSTKVFITFNGPVYGSWWVSSKQEGSFRVTLENEQDEDVSFDYFLVQTENQPSAPASVPPTQNPQTPPSNTPPPSNPSDGADSGSVGTLPNIELVGDAAEEVVVGDSWQDEGAIADDAEDGDLTSQIQVDGDVDTSVPGLYTITYTVTDSDGNMTGVSRMVSVIEEPRPSSNDEGSGDVGSETSTDDVTDTDDGSDTGSDEGTSETSGGSDNSSGSPEGSSSGSDAEGGSSSVGGAGE